MPKPKLDSTPMDCESPSPCAALRIGGCKGATVLEAACQTLAIEKLDQSSMQTIRLRVHALSCRSDPRSQAPGPVETMFKPAASINMVYAIAALVPMVRAAKQD